MVKHLSAHFGDKFPYSCLVTPILRQLPSSEGCRSPGPSPVFRQLGCRQEPGAAEGRAQARLENRADFLLRAPPESWSGGDAGSGSGSHAFSPWAKLACLTPHVPASLGRRRPGSCLNHFWSESLTCVQPLATRSGRESYAVVLGSVIPSSDVSEHPNSAAMQHARSEGGDSRRRGRPCVGAEGQVRPERTMGR